MELRIVKYLTEEHMFPLNDQDTSGNTPLHIACTAQKVQNAMYLSIRPSCNPNIKNAEGLTPLHVAIKVRHAMLIKHLLGVSNLDKSVTDSSGRTAVAIISDDPQLVPCLVKKTSTASLSESAEASAHRQVRKSESDDVIPIWDKAPALVSCTGKTLWWYNMCMLYVIKCFDTYGM